ALSGRDRLRLRRHLVRRHPGHHGGTGADHAAVRDQPLRRAGHLEMVAARRQPRLPALLVPDAGLRRPADGRARTRPVAAGPDVRPLTAGGAAPAPPAPGGVSARSPGGPWPAPRPPAVPRPWPIR